METTNQPQKPATTIRAGGVKATVWENHTNDGNIYYSISLSRSYKDGEEWKETNSYFRDDLPKVELVTRKAFEFIQLSPELHDEKSSSRESSGFTEKLENERSAKTQKASAAAKG